MKTAIHITRQGRSQYLRHTLTNQNRKFVTLDGERWTVRGLVIGDPDFVTADHEQE